MSNPHTHVEVRTNDHEFYKGGFLVVFVDVLKVISEGGAKNFIEIGLTEEVCFRIVIIGRKDVCGVGGFFEAKLNVVSKEEAIGSDGYHIA